MCRKIVTMMSLVIVLGAVLAVTPGVTCGASLVGHWALDGDAKDSSPNKNNGTVNGNVTFIPGKYGQAAQFSGSGAYIQIPTTTGNQLLSTGTYGVAVWVNAPDTGDHLILMHGLGCSTWSSWFLGMSGGEPDATRHAGMLVFGVRSVGNTPYDSVMTDGIAGEWVHVAAIYDGAVLKLYTNGQEMNSLATSTVPYNNTDALYIGGDPGCIGREYYNGLVDDLYIYNRALSVDQIQGLMAGVDIYESDGIPRRLMELPA